MKVGVFAVLFAQRPFEEALDYIAQAGCGAVEIGAGGYPGAAHCDPAALLADKAARARFIEAVASRGLEISALSCHGNPLHPNREIAEQHDAAFRDTVRLAKEIGVGTVITFSGCPGDSDAAQKPNWVTCPWPCTWPEVSSPAIATPPPRRRTSPTSGPQHSWDILPSWAVVSRPPVTNSMWPEHSR